MNAQQGVAVGRENSTMVTDRYAKFAIGFTAGVALAVIPRAAQMLSAPDDAEFFGIGFIYLSIVLSVILGVVIVVIEHEVPRAPKDTFFSALAIPGLLAGSLHSAVAKVDQSQISEKIEKQNIRIERITTPRPNSLPEQVGFRFDLIPAAYAQNHEETPGARGFLRQFAPIPKKDYYVEIDKAESAEAARQKLQDAKAMFPRASTVKDGKGQYRILTEDQGRTRLEAATEALSIKDRTAKNPVILEITQ